MSTPLNASQRIGVTVAYFGAFVCLGLTIGLLGPTLPGLAQQTRASLSTIGYLFTARSVGYVLGSFRGGRLFDRRSGNPLMTWMLLSMAVFTFLVPITSKFSILLLLMVALGISEALLDVGANTLLVWTHGDQAAPYLNALHSLFGVGALLAPLIVALALKLGYQSTSSYLALSAILIPLAVSISLWPSPRAPAATEGEDSKSGNRSMLVLISAFLFLYVGAETGFSGWIFTYVTEFRLSNAETASYLTALFWASLTSGRLLNIPTAIRVKPHTILFASLVGSLLSLALMLAGPGSLTIIFVGTVGLGLSMASIFPAAISYTNQQMKLSGAVAGWLVMAASFGAMTIPLLIGQLFQSVGPRFLLLVVVSTLLLALGVLVGMNHLHKS